METVSITRKGEYVAHVEGSSHTGRLTWTERDGVRSADSTVVPPEIGGRGIAGLLVAPLLAHTRAQRFKVRPACSDVDTAFAKNPDWADLKA